MSIFFKLFSWYHSSSLPAAVPQLPPLPPEVWVRIGSFLEDNLDLVALSHINKAMGELFGQQLQIAKQIDQHVARPLLAECLSQKNYDYYSRYTAKSYLNNDLLKPRFHWIHRNRETGLWLFLYPRSGSNVHWPTGFTAPYTCVGSYFEESNTYLLKVQSQTASRHIHIDSVALRLNDDLIHSMEKTALERVATAINAKLAKQKNEDRDRIVER